MYNFGGPITDAPQPATRNDEGRWTGGSVSQWVEELTGAVLEHGAAGFLYRESAGLPSQTALRRWSQEVVPAVREAIAHPA